MNKYQQINDILLFFKQLVKENPNIDLNSLEYKDIAYKNITRFGVRQSEVPIDISQLNYFNAWVNNFSSINDINCFWDPRWAYFCQFTNGEEIQTDYIKMYIPLDLNHLYNGANMIFEFMAKNKIIHQSKIAKNIRFDDIVIRVTNKEDALKIADFVKNNKYIQDGLIKENPFTYSKDGISYACDGRISYNSTICDFINKYIMSKKNDLDSVNVSDFYNYILNYYEKVFEEPYNIQQLMNDFNLDMNMASSVFLNYKQVIALILKTSNPNFSFDDFINHFEACNNNLNINYLKITKIDNTYTEEQLENLFYETITKMSIKYGKYNALETFNNYLQTGIPTNITRLDNLRDRVINSNLRNYITKILQFKGISLEQYYYQLSSTLTGRVDKEQIIIDAVVETFNKYKEEYPENTYEIKNQLTSSLKNVVYAHSYMGFTRQNNARKNMIEHILPNDILAILNKYYGMEQGILNEEQMHQFFNMYVENIVDLNCSKVY